MKYYIIPKQIAELLNLTEIRKGGENGYVVTVGDLAAYGVGKAIENGAREVSESEAEEFIKNLK